MFARWGRKADVVLRRGTEAVHEAVRATVVHARRIAGTVGGAATRVTRETQDLAWGYQDVATDLLRPSSQQATKRNEVEHPDEGRPTLRVVGSDD